MDRTPRLNRQEMMLEIARVVSMRGTCSRAQVGCVITKDGRILSLGYNGSPPGQPHCIDVGCEMEYGHCIRTIHAEANAIAFAAREGISVSGATLYVVGWDGGICPRCEKLARSAGLIRVITTKMLQGQMSIVELML
jgi:dCMP deaminase